MPRKKTLTSEELIRLTDEFRLSRPDSKIKIPELGAFIRDRGYPVQDYTLRRDELLKQYVKKLNESPDEDAVFKDVVAFHPLDVEAFIQNHKSFPAMKQALEVRDRYYAKIAAAAADAIVRRKEMEKERREALRKYDGLKAELEEIRKMELKKALSEKDEVITKLKHILDYYVYPDMANALLEKEGVLELVTSVITPAKAEEVTITASAEIEKSKFAVINSMRDEFND